MATVDIVIPCYNGVELTKGTVSSLRAHTTGVEYRLIMVDDGSTDGTKEYLSELAKEPNVKVITMEKNSGYCKAVNAGLKETTAMYVMTLNNDVVIQDDAWLVKMINHFNSREVGAVGPTSNFVLGRQDIKYNWAHRKEYDASYLIGFCLLTKKAILDLVGNLDEQFENDGCDDLDWSIRLKKAGYNLVIARDVYVHHLGSRTLSTLPDYGQEKYKRGQEKLRKKWGDERVNECFAQRQLLTVGIPSLGWIHWKFITETMFGVKRPPETNVAISPRTIVHLARNKIVQDFLKRKCEYLFFTDDDMIIPTETIEKLMSYNVDVATAMGFKRGEPYTPCVFQYNAEGKTYNPIEPKQGFVEVDACGTFAMLIHRRVFEAIADPWFEWGQYGEDLMFCRKIKAAGFRIFCDSNLLTTHLGDPMEVNYEVFDAHRKMLNQKGGNNGTKTDSSPVKPGC